MESGVQRRPREAPARPPPPRASTSQRHTISQEASSTFRSFQKLHDKAHSLVQKGLLADEEGDIYEAKRHYTNGLMLLEEVLQTDCDNMTGSTPDEIDSAKQMQLKMTKTKLQITYRMESMQNGEHNAGVSNCETGIEELEGGVRLPSYDEATSSIHSSLQADAALGDSIMSAEYPDLASSQHTPREGTELFTISDGVQIFYITPQGFVSAPTYPASLRIIKLKDAADGNIDSLADTNSPPAFIQVGDWFYPLIPGASPVLQTTYGAYLFPDLSREGSGCSVGLMLPDTASAEEKLILEDIIHNYSLVQEQTTSIQSEDLVLPSAPLEEPEEATTPKNVREESTDEKHQESTTAGKISNGISVASKWISWGVGKGAEKAGQLISYGSAKLRNSLHPEEQPKPVDPRIQKGMARARKVTHVAVSVSSFVVTKLGEATMALGRQVAPHIRKQGEKLLPKSVKSGKGQSKFDGVIEVAASGIQGFGTVYMSLESAAKALAKSLANETVATVQHKYGDEAGQLTENTVYAAGNIAMTAYNVDNLGIKAISKRAAKDTGKAVLHDIHQKKGGNKQQGEASNDDSGSSKDSSGNRNLPM